MKTEELSAALSTEQVPFAKNKEFFSGLGTLNINRHLMANIHSLLIPLLRDP
jgi:hypothetical protein